MKKKDRLIDFQKKLLSESFEKDHQYIIGIDANSKNPAYVLLWKYNKDRQILLAKSFDNEEKFKQEVENLAKYFNAVVFYENP